MSLQQELTVMQEVNLDDENIQKVHYPDLPATCHYLQMDDVQMAALQEHQKSQNRVSFLVEFYKKRLLQHTIIMAFFLIGLGRWFNGLLVVNFKYGSYTPFRWTWWVVLISLIILQICLPFIRNCSMLVSKQKSIFYIQTVLISLLLIGITARQRGNDHHFTIGFIIALVIGGLMIHDLFQLFLISHNKTRHYQIFIKFILVGSLILNFIVALFTSEINREYPIAEGIILYFLFYIHQLNESLLLHPCDLEEDYIIGEILKNILQDGVVITQERNHCIINKDVFFLIGAGLVYLTVVIVTIIIGNAVAIIVLIVSSVSLLSFIVETRVASRRIQQEDVYFAVCLTYLDMISPIKNIFRTHQ